MDDPMLAFIVELALDADHVGNYHDAADFFMLAVKRTDGRDPAYLLAVNQCRARALGVIS